MTNFFCILSHHGSREPVILHDWPFSEHDRVHLVAGPYPVPEGYEARSLDALMAEYERRREAGTLPEVWRGRNG